MFIGRRSGLPKHHYLLLAQKKMVVDALEEIAPGNALAYLEKIIQMSFDVPSVERNQLQTLFFKGLNELLSGPQMEKRFSNTYWGSVFPHLFPLFRNLRDPGIRRWSRLRRLLSECDRLECEVVIF